MEDEHQSTLKKKIQILFQLGKWSDVVKLCVSYGEKYGKDAEIETIRFKSERHMGVPETKIAQKGSPGAPVGKQDPSDLPIADTVVSAPATFTVPPTRADELSAFSDEKPAYDPAPEAGELELDEHLSEDELVISDPFADDAPGFSLAPEQPPVVIGDPQGGRKDADFFSGNLEMDGHADEESASRPEESELDFSDIGAMSIDAEPDLIPASPSVMPEPEPIPAAQVVPGFEEEKAAASPSPAAVRFDVPERVETSKPPRDSETAGDAKPKRPSPGEPDMFAEKAPARKRGLGIKLLLLIVLPLVAAAALWLALSGKLDFSGSDEPPAASQPQVRPAARKRPTPAKPVKPAVSPERAAQLAAQEKEFAEKLSQAEDLDRRGDLLKAWAVLLEAKKIKETEPLRRLEEQLARKMHEAEEQAKKEKEVVQNQWQLESQAFAKAEAEDTLAAWRAFLKSYPDGESAQRAERRIVALEKKAQESAQQQLLARIQSAQKARLRANYLNLSPADVAGLARRGPPSPAQFEAYEHGGASVTIDFATGLMWTLWNKPMAYEKAKWWANRVTAGYGGWRLPTAEEALSLLQADRGLYAGLADFAVWTGDSVSDQPRTAWALRLPGGQFIAAVHNQICYVWAVRKAGK